MSLSLEGALLTVYRQSLIENKKTITLEDKTFAVRSTAKRKLKQIDFQFEGRDLRGLEQNPETKSRWAKMARDRKKVMQFLERGKYSHFVYQSLSGDGTIVARVAYIPPSTLALDNGGTVGGSAIYNLTFGTANNPVTFLFDGTNLHT